MPNRVSGLETVTLDLSEVLDNVGATPPALRDQGSFNVWGNSFAAEQLQLQAGDSLIIDGVRFRLGRLNSAEPDNVCCAGQLVPVPPGRYDWLYLLVAGERQVEDELGLHFSDSTADFERIRVSDFWAASAIFGETVALRSESMHYPYHVQYGISATMWCQRVPVTRRAELTLVRLPRNPALHVFAISLLRSDGSGRPPEQGAER
jgi:hypothetical protein